MKRFKTAGEIKVGVVRCGLWQEPARAPPARAGFTEDPEAVPETVCVPIDTFLAEL